MRPRATKASRRKPAELAPVRIDRIGAEGDGVAGLLDGTRLYVPFTLPGETVTPRVLYQRGDGWHASAEAISVSSDARVVPPCRHFGYCGGCALQHWRAEDYRKWKSGLLSHALRQAGFSEPDPFDYVAGEPGSRRRIDFAARRAGGGIMLGLHKQRSSKVIDLTECFVLHPRLTEVIEPLRGLLEGLRAFRREASLVINLLDTGPDLLMRTDAGLALEDRLALTRFATEHGLPRVSHSSSNDAPETIAMLRPPGMTFSGVAVRPPPGAFLQATAAGERAIVEATLRWVPPPRGGKTRVAELYAGCGTLTFALANVVRVTAYEGDLAAHEALAQAINSGAMAGRVEAFRRDLIQQPLSAKELAAFAAVVLDPPYRGAAPQIAQIAAAGTPTVIYVSCNPITLSQDARLLRQSGYELAATTAIDQFLWSARLESVSVFRRG